MTLDTADFPPARSLRKLTLTRSQLAACLAEDDGPWLLEDCVLDGDFSKLVLRGWVFRRCQLAGSRWTGADLEQSQWLQCRGGGTDFQRTVMTESLLVGCDFNNSRWLHAKLPAARFHGCKLTGANFKGISALGLDFSETLLVGAVLSGLSFRKQRLEQLDFSDADLSGCDFRDAVFVGGSLRNAYIPQADFTGADLREVALDGLKIIGSSAFSKALISSSQAATLLAEFGLRVG